MKNSQLGKINNDLGMGWNRKGVADWMAFITNRLDADRDRREVGGESGYGKFNYEKLRY
jgi:hypothetical protein